MNRLFTHPRVWAAGLACCLAAGATAAWALWPKSPGAEAGDPPAGDVLAALPRAAGTSAADRAVAKWSERVRQSPSDEGAWAALGDALMQKARETADASYYGHAERAFTRALALNPKHPAATTGMAWVQGGRHEFEKSIDWANKAIALDPRDHSAYGLLGDAAAEMGDYEAAFEYYQKMLDLRPDLASYSRGAHLLFLHGNVRKATWLMGKAVAAGGPYAENTAWCRAQLALMYFANGNLVAAEQELRDALARAPHNFHLLAAQGKVKAARQDYAAAVACLKEASAIAPRHEVLVELGDLYLLTGNREEAQKQFALVETIHKLNRANGVVGDSLMARFYADHDRRLGEALRMAQEEYKTRKNVFVADTLAWCYYKNGRYPEARRLIRKALQLKTPDAALLFHSGMIHARLGDRHTGQLHLGQALSLNPNFSPVFAPVAVATLKELGSRPPEAK
jgi:tetratricopeptide (TPR) repeat protein